MMRRDHRVVLAHVLACLLVVSMLLAAAPSSSQAGPVVASARPLPLIDRRPARPDTTAQEEEDAGRAPGDVVEDDANSPYPPDEYDDATPEVPLKLVLYGIHMVPTGRDAKESGRAGWGGGGKIVASVGPLAPVGAFGLGFEVVNLLSRTRKFFDPVTQLRVEQQTSQNLYRLYLGAEIGAHGHGFVRPYAGASLAAWFHNIHTDVVIPNDADPDNEIRQSLDSDGDASLGYDLTLGADLNFRGILVDGGVRFLKSFGVPHQLGLEAERIHPGYVQIYLGIGVDLSAGGERFLD